MPTAIERISRRALLGAAACTALPAWSASPATLYAAWDDGASHLVGVLRGDAGALRVRASLDVPTRAHGLAAGPEGTLLAVARRPGDWLVRWHPSSGKPRWHWNANGHSFNGHIERRGSMIFATETGIDSGQGLLVLRDAAPLRERAVWPTRGRDPHDFLFDGNGALWVANGGITTDAICATSRWRTTVAWALHFEPSMTGPSNATPRHRWRSSVAASCVPSAPPPLRGETTVTSPPSAAVFSSAPRAPTSCWPALLTTAGASWRPRAMCVRWRQRHPGCAAARPMVCCRSTAIKTFPTARLLFIWTTTR